MIDLNPCKPGCPRRSAFCRKDCEAFQLAQEEKARIRAIREKDMVVLGYLKDSSERKRRRVKNKHAF